MNGQNDEEQIYNKIEKRLSALEKKFEHLNSSVEEQKSERTELKDTIKNMQDSFHTVNKNIETILSRLDDVASRHSEGMAENFMGKRMMRNPLRKLAIGTVSSVIGVTNVLTEAASHIKESFEDIVAEAQYEQKKKHMNMMRESNMETP